LLSKIDDVEYLQKMAQYLSLSDLRDVKPADFDKLITSLKKKVSSYD